MPLSAALPLSEHRALVRQYLRGIGFPFTSVAGRIIEERLPLHGASAPLRPGLVLWATKARGEGEDALADALPVAAAFDLFDRFMVLHNELAAGSATPAVERWGLGQSLNAGDALFAVAFRALASDVRNPARRLQAARVVGEAVLAAIESAEAESGARDELTGAALQAGAIVGGASSSAAQAFARAGRLLGSAAQTADAANARRMAAQAVTALRRHVDASSLHAFEQAAHYVAQPAP